MHPLEQVNRDPSFGHSNFHHLRTRFLTVGKLRNVQTLMMKSLCTSQKKLYSDQTLTQHHGIAIN
jgi:hypothetical protein